MRKAFLSLLAGVVVLLGIGLASTPAQATVNHPVVSACNTGWYVNPDEESLLPTQVESGFLFDGASLVHRAIDPIVLSSVPAGSLVSASVTGAAPLFKMETTSAYSTINIDAAGKFWSSKIGASDPGGQSNPVATAGDLVGKWSGYTATTKVYSIGVGYGNDTGNTAVVTSIKFGETTYNLACKPTSTPPPAEPKECEAYTYGNKNFCELGYNGDEYNCNNEGNHPGIKLEHKPVVLVDYEVDPWGLDGVKGPSYTGEKGIGCEDGNPGGGGGPTTPAPSVPPTPAGPIVTPTPEETTEAPAYPTTEPVNTDTALPVTGPSGGKMGLILFASGGGTLLAVGVVLLYLARRRIQEDNDQTGIIPTVH